MLTACLKSICDATKSEEREILIVDDGSEHDIEVTEQIPEGCQIIRMTHQGVSAARNAGIERANGRFIQFVDGDDELNPQVYAACLARIAKTKRTDLLFFRHSTTKDNPKMKGFHRWYATTYLCRRNLRGASWGYIIREQSLKNLRFDTALQFGEDEMFTAQLFRQSRWILITDSEAYYYRQHAQSTTHQQESHRVQRRLSDLEHVIISLKHQKDAKYKRRIAQLTMDLLYQTMRLQPQQALLDETIDRLRGEQLFPLPIRCYTMKYFLFQMLTRSSIGRQLLKKICRA